MDKGDEVFRTIIQTLPDIVYEINPDGKFIYVNEAISSLGYTPDELIGKHFTEILYSDDAKLINSSTVLRKLKGKKIGNENSPQLFDERRTGKRITKNLRVRMISKGGKDKDDSLVEGEVVSLGLYESGGKNKKAYSGTIGVIRDISDVKRREKALLLTEKHYRLLIENSSEIITIISSDGTILYKSDSILKILGYQSINLIGENEFDFIHSDDKKTLNEILDEQRVESDIPPFIDYHFRHSEGTWRMLETSIRKIFGTNDKTMCFILNSRDVTEQKKAEEERNAYIKIVTSRMKGLDCLHSISTLTHRHDISMSEIFKSVVQSIPRAFQNWKSTYARLVFDGEECKSDNFKESSLCLRSDIFMNEKKKGFVEACYPEDKNLTDENPFLKEEEYLIESVANAMGVFAERKWAENELKESFNTLRNTLEGTIEAIASAVEARDAYTAGHQRRTSNLACAIAKKMCISDDIIEGIRIAALIHDFGKIAIPAEILSKPSRLLDIEFELIKRHPSIGFDILKTIDFPWPIAGIVYQHHERLDGSGYPLSLEGDDILLESRIIGVSDVVEAMASHRPYRVAIGIDKALEEISENSGNHYDQNVVAACLSVFKEDGFSFDDTT